MSKGKVDIRMGGRYRDKDEALTINPDGEIVTEIIYDENIEWQASKLEESNVKIDFNAIAAPAHGIKHIKVGIVGTTPAGLISTAGIAANLAFNYAEPLAADSDLIIPIADLFLDNKSDSTAAGIRHLIYHQILSLPGIDAKLINNADQSEIILRGKTLTPEAWAIPEIDFAANIAGVLTLTNHLNDIPPGNYTLELSGIIRLDQQFTVLTQVQPATAALSFTRAAAIDATAGKITLSLKNPVAWLPDTALILDLYNDTARVGTLTIDAAHLFGFDPTNVADYQRIDLNMTDFNLFGSHISKVVISPAGVWPIGEFSIDWIVLTAASTANIFQSIIDQINQNIINSGDLITNELKSYIGDLIENLTITWEQITGSPVINQEFKDYIQTLIDNLTIRWEQITGSPVLNQTLIDLFNQYKTDIQNSFADFIVGDTVTNALQQYIDNLLTEIRNQLTEVTNATTINQTLLTEITNQITEIDQTIQYITEGDAITQEYKDYLEQKFIDIQDLITNITEGAVITEEISQYIDNYVTELITQLQQYIDNSVGDAITNITTVKGEATRLISGTITWIENLDFLVSDLVYQILNRQYRSVETLVTIPANAENNPRFAVIWADIFGNVGYILGAAAAAPLVPHVNDSTQIALWTVYIPALGTEPAPDPDGETGDIVTVVIYDENIEWITEKTEEAGITIDFDAITDPQQGAKHIALTVAAAGTPGGFENIGLQTDEYTGDFFANLGVFGYVNSFGMSLSTLLPANNTDVVSGGIRTLTWYKINKQDVNGYAILKSTGARFNLYCSQVQTTAIDKPEIDFNVTTANGLILKATPPMVDGLYDIYLTIGYIQYIQKYNLTSVVDNITPAAAKITFTAPVAAGIEGGNIGLSLKTSVAWLSNTGLIFELFNGAEKVGSLAMLPGSFYGFNPANPDYQRVIIPLADFAPTAAEITALVIRPVNAWPNGSLLIDNVTLQTGLSIEEPVAEFIEAQAFEYRDVTEAGQRYTLDLSAYYRYKVLGVTLRADADTITAKVLINETPVVGLNPNISTSVKQFFAATAANSVAIGDELILEIDGLTGAASAIVGSIKYVRI